LNSLASHVPTPGYPGDFYGFPEVPFHIQLGMRFERPQPEGPALVTLPARPDLLGGDGRHSTSALYTVGEVASGIAICDALLAGMSRDTTTLMPLVLTTRAVFAPLIRAGGEIRSRTSFLGDAEAAVQKLGRTRKVKVEVQGEMLSHDDEVVGRIHVYFYVRLMELSRLQAMAGELMPAMAERARGTLGSGLARG
jgi:hypothetical protein